MNNSFLTMLKSGLIVNNCLWGAEASKPMDILLLNFVVHCSILFNIISFTKVDYYIVNPEKVELNAEVRRPD